MSRNPVSQAILPALAERWSPYSFDPDRSVAGSDLDALFEAARWAASAFNDQPWRYIVGVKGQDDGVWEKIHGLLMEGNQPWTANAPVLVLGIYDSVFAHNGKPNGSALHDLGAASAQLTAEATARGLVVHQMAGVHGDKAHAAFGLSESLKVVTALAIGYAGQGQNLPDGYAERDQRPRSRKPVSELVLAGGWS